MRRKIKNSGADITGIKHFSAIIPLFESVTIRKKIMAASILIVIIPLLVLSIAAGKILSSRAEAIFLERMDAELRHIDSVITGLIGNAMQDLDTLCSDPAFSNIGPLSLRRYIDTETPTDMQKITHKGDELAIYNIMKRIAVNHPDYIEIYLGSRYGGFVSSGDYILRAGYDPRIRPWYNDAIAEAGKTTLAKSYLSVTGEYVTAVVKARQDSSGDTIWVAGIDISLKYLSALIQSIRIGKTGSLVLIENDGTILAHPARPDLISRNITDLGIPEMEKFFSYRDSVIHYTFEGKRKTGKTYNSPHVRWKLMAIINSDEVSASGSFVRYVISFTALTILIFCAILYIYIMKRIINPVRELTDFGHSIAEGNLETPIVMNRNDELGRLAEDFNDMMYKLKDSIESVKAIIEMMPSIIIQLDTDGRIIEWNREAEAFTGISIDEARGKMLSELKPGIAVYLESAKSMPETEKPLSFYRIKIPGLNERYFNLFIFLLRTAHSSSLVFRIDDITEFEKKDEQIRHIQKMESIGLLASGIAHDFNNILGGILATVSLLRHRIMKGKITRAVDVCNDLEIAERSCETGAAIASQLLNISKKESDLELHEYDLNDIISQIVVVCRKSFDRSIDITHHPFEGKAPAMINSSQIQQSILNLCINASHAMTIMRKPGESQGGHLEIGIMEVNADAFFVNSHYGSREGRYWQIFVKDTGVGMDSSTISKIFDPFFTTKTATSVQGTGLGLSIVYSIIKSHGGFIDVYSEVGLGSKFVIYIPALTESEISEFHTGPDEICRGDGTILIIDDEETIRIYTEQMLDECGYSVLKAGSGSEGIEIYRENRSQIKAVLLDMIMPGKSGLETLSDLVNINPGIKVLMTSGFLSDKIIENVMHAGASGFIVKPYTMTQLSGKISSITSE